MNVKTKNFEEKLEELNKKIIIEYEKVGLFPFLKKHCKELVDYNNEIQITTKHFGLSEIENIFKHPDTDLEKYYIREIVNIVKQNEIKTIYPYLAKFKIDIIDSNENIIIGQNKYNKAIFFEANVADICIPTSKLSFGKNYIGLSNLESVQLGLGSSYPSGISSFITINKI